MLHRKATVVAADLEAAGVPKQQAALLAAGAELSGKDATAFVQRDDIRAIEITEEAQTKLFNQVYATYEKDARRICTKPDVEARYGACNWEMMDQEVKEIIIDLLYRGDYSPSTRRKVQRALVSGKYNEIRKALAELNRVPADRRKRRDMHLERAAMKQLKPL